MTVEIRRGFARFTERAEGRITHHSLSFGESYDPERLSFGPMVCHDDHLIGAGRGFESHRHASLEIVTYVVSGTLVHRGDDGVPAHVPAGSVAVLSAGPDGTQHSEHASEDGPCRFVQVWLQPVEGEPEPGYAVASTDLSTDELTPIAQPRRDSVLWAVRLDAGSSVMLPFAARLHAFVASGGLTRSSMAEPLTAGDAFEMTNEPAHIVTAQLPTLLLVWAFYDGAAPVLAELGGAAVSWEVS